MPSMAVEAYQCQYDWLDISVSMAGYRHISTSVSLVIETC